MDKVTLELRRNAKAINFELFTGLAHLALPKNLNIPKKAAADYIAKYFQNIPVLKIYVGDY